MEVNPRRVNVPGEWISTAMSRNMRNSCTELLSSGKESYVKPPSSNVVPPKSLSHLTNLELLTKVASGMKYDTNQDANLEYGDENVNFNYGQSREAGETNCKPRKEKSLSILCDKFLKLFPLTLKPGNYMEISLDQATQFIGTDRRRIYDILIVLECLQMASKVCKNHYQWHGTQHLEGTLSQLKWMALRLGLFQNVCKSDCISLLYEDSTKENKASDLNILNPGQVNAQTHKALSASISQPHSFSTSDNAGEMLDHKLEEESDLDYKDTSLGIMCQKLLMLFLIKSKTITLDNAAKILLGASGIDKDCHKVKTKIRRLYDIANVLSSLELIKKVNVTSALPTAAFLRSNKKPAFQYIGPHVEPKPVPDHALVTLHTTRHSLLGHPLHAACEKKCSRKKKTRPPCPLQPKLLNGNNGSSIHVEPANSTFIPKRTASLAFPSGMGSSREKFSRSHSENCIGEGPKCHGPLRSDILQVAELELQRICEEEQLKKEKRISSEDGIVLSPVNKSASENPKVNWRHHHSENCISISPTINRSSNTGFLKNSKDISWKNSILKDITVRMNASTGTNSLIKNNKSTAVLKLQTSNNVRKDTPICVLNRPSPVAKTVERKFIPFSGKSAIPIVIQSVPNSSSMRSISINPVPISGSNCIMGPAYIIRQHLSGSDTDLNPVSICLSKGDHLLTSKEVFCVEGNSNTETDPLKTH